VHETNDILQGYRADGMERWGMQRADGRKIRDAEIRKIRQSDGLHRTLGMGAADGMRGPKTYCTQNRAEPKKVTNQRPKPLY